MKDEIFWSLIVLAWVFGWATLWYLRRRAVERRSLALREMLHRERMAALDKGVPLPELPADEEITPAWLQPEAERIRAAWMRRLALFVGLLALFTGVGMCAGFYWSPDRGFHVMWTLGLIPALGGVGALLFVLFSGPQGRSSETP